MKRESFQRFVCSLTLAVLLSSCASLLYKEIEAQPNLPIDSGARLGTVEGVDPREHGFIDFGMATDAKSGLLSIKVTADKQRLIFPENAEQIVWYGLRIGKMTSPVFTVLWYGPSGQLVRQAKMKSGDTKFYKDTLLLQDIPADQREGRWRVQVRHGEEIIDDRYFKIIKPETAFPAQ